MLSKPRTCLNASLGFFIFGIIESSSENRFTYAGKSRSCEAQQRGTVERMWMLADTPLKGSEFRENHKCI